MGSETVSGLNVRISGSPQIARVRAQKKNILGSWQWSGLALL